MDFEVKAPTVGNYANSPLGWMIAGPLIGAGLGRYVAAPLAEEFLGADRKKARKSLTLMGAGVGMLPGLAYGATQSKIRGNFFAPGGPAHTPEEAEGFKEWYDRTPQAEFDASRKQADFGNTLWQPSFPVMKAMDDITNNDMMSTTQKAMSRMLIAQAGREQGVGRTGLASAGSLISALPSILVDAAPSVIGAWGLSKVLGLPSSVKNTAIGASLVYSALKNFGAI